MFLADSALDSFTNRDIIDLYQIYECLIFSDSTNLAIDNVSDLDVKAFHRKLVFNKVCVLFAANYSNYGGEDVLFIDIKALLKLFLIVFCKLLTHLYLFVDELVHAIITFNILIYDVVING
jgi:hypothetical protein